ncbi:hypothetical protein [Nocardia sp. NPDC052566]|uniref:hypothetical protein n=1 Tax=Nocardia sp. NPDC052566 TaxID=3364330 RepID=UPI0037C5F27C
MPFEFSRRRFRAKRFLFALLALTGLVVVAGCDSTGGGARTAATRDVDAADCTAGAKATSSLQPVLQRLSDSLTAVGPAAERNDLDDVLAQLDGGREAADRISGTLGAAATGMTASPIQVEFRSASTAGAGLRDLLTEVRGTLASGRGNGDQTPPLQSSVTAFNTSIERLSLACSTYFSASTVEPPTITPSRTPR